MTWREWFQQNTDKLLLSVIWFISLLFVLFLILRSGVSPENISWAREASGTILGAILGLITGVALSRHTDTTPKL